MKVAVISDALHLPMLEEEYHLHYFHNLQELDSCYDILLLGLHTLNKEEQTLLAKNKAKKVLLYENFHTLEQFQSTHLDAFIKSHEFERIAQYLYEQQVYFHAKTSYNRELEPITKLPNHIALEKEIQQSDSFSLLLLNIDNFSSINKHYGLGLGDKVLIDISNYLKTLLLKCCTLYKLHADEFAILVQNDETNVTELIRSIKAFFNAIHLSYDKTELHITFTVAIDDTSSKDALQNAKFALSQIRKTGKNRFDFYTKYERLQKKHLKHLADMKMIIEAINENRIKPYFQQIINSKTSQIEKYECLARIELSDGTLLNPAEFIAVAKLCGLTTTITKNIIDKSFRTFADNSFEFSINITEEDLQEEYIEHYLLYKCEKYHIEPKRVIIEILESITTDMYASLFPQLNRLKTLGFKIAVDDFGVCDSNLSRFLKIDVDYIKVAAEFIKNVDKDVVSYNIVETIVFLAQKVGAKTIAEHIHNKDVLDKLHSMGIDYYQGFYFSEPKQFL